MSSRSFSVLVFGAVVLHSAGIALAQFPQPKNSEKEPGEPMPAEEAVTKWQLPPGIHVELFASEPDVMNPIAMTWDARGRLWVAENFTYAERGVRFDPNQRDRVLVFELGKDGVKTPKRSVFMDGLQSLTSIAVGQGGVWLLCPPKLLFISDPDSDGVADSAPKVVLDGFTVAESNHHNLANGLKWGPDGWLYGRNGASCPGEVGAPGTPASERIPTRGGIWRYHPQRRVFEALCHGTTNPWGHDWNGVGEGFFVNTVNGHLWQMIPGAHFARPHTNDPNPHAYVSIDQTADHYHFDTGKSWTASRDGSANELGGGHAHSGAMIYNGGQWPEEYDGLLFTLNFHGRRMNLERLERSGSGYVGKHETDICVSGDSWFRGVDLSTGPDGAVYVLDWSDTGECHENSGVHRTSGRIYRFFADNEKKKIEDPDIAERGDLSLANLHRRPNAWFARQAAGVLRDRWLKGASVADAIRELRQGFDWDTSTEIRLRQLWTLWGVNGIGKEDLRKKLYDRDENIRVWAIRLLTDAFPLDTVMGKRPKDEQALNATLITEFTRLAWEDPSGLVHLTLASTLCRLPLAQRVDLAVPLLATAQWADDPRFPAMMWYALQPIAEEDPMIVARLFKGCTLPVTRQCIARFMAEGIEKKPEALALVLAEALGVGADVVDEVMADVLKGMNLALAGWRKAPMPAGWSNVVERFGNDEKLGAQVRALSAVFGDGRALGEVRKVALDEHAEVGARKRAIETLTEMNDSGLREVCEKVLTTNALTGSAALGLSRFSDASVGKLLAGRLGKAPADARKILVGVLVSRESWFQYLLEAVASGAINRSEISASDARQIAATKDAAVLSKLKEVWGEVRAGAGAKQELITKWKGRLTAEVLAKASPTNGAVVFQQVCATCHRMYGKGGEIGPDLTGSDRRNIDYLLENIADPSAVVAPDFRLNTITMKDGRILSGMVGAQTEKTIELKTFTGRMTLERADIVKKDESPLSMMPEGLLEAFTETQVRDLFSFLMSNSAPQ
ncbi:MAG: PVC-type heme-binding CxxCH protein [Verrucomicrobiota bacterium]